MSDAGLMPVGGCRATASDRPATRPHTLSMLSDAALGFGLPVLWALSHPFGGIEGDAKIYMGRALADLDPAGVGRDLMFANDGQSSFSLFRVVARDLVRSIGLDATVGTLAVVNLLVWFAAVTVFARSFVKGRALVMVLAAVCVLSRVYTPWNLLASGELIAVPRPLAETCVLFALAALIDRNYALCLGSLVLGILLHPIMAAPGVGVLLIVLGLQDRRWFAAAALFAGTILIAGLAGLPLVARLFTRIDPVWRGILAERTPYLFPHLWPAQGLTRPVVQAATILVACTFVEPRVRRVFVATIIVGWLGWLAAFVVGDGLSDLLVVQAQLWRAFWLPTVVATLTAGLCLWHLPKLGPRGHVTLATLCIAWVMINDVPIAPIAAVAAVALHCGGQRLSFQLGRAAVAAAWTIAIVFAGLDNWASLRVLLVEWSRMPPGLTTGWTIFFGMNLVALPLLLMLAAWRAWPRSAATMIAAPLLVAAGTLFLASFWDVRTPARRDLDAASLKPDLVAMLAARPGEVLWLDGDEIWFWAGRGNWNGVTHGGSIVFSRDLANAWHARATTMVEHGLATPFLLDPWARPDSLKPLRLDPDAVADFCRRPDAPATIVTPIEPDAPPPARLGATVWASNWPGWKLVVGDGDVRWMPRDHFAIIPCGAARS